MKKQNKKLFKVVALSAMASAFALCGGMALNTTASAETPTSGTFKMDGASVRYAEYTGIRFETLISKAEYDAVTKDATTVTNGTWIIPASVLGENELNETTAVTYQANNVILDELMPTDSEGDCTYVADGDYLSFLAYLDGFDTTDSAKELARYKAGIVARSYICVDGTYHYSDTITRSIGYVAQRAYHDPDTPDSQKTQLQGYMTKLAGTQVDYTVEKYLQNADGSYSSVASETKVAQTAFNTTVEAATGDYTDANGVVYEAIPADDGIAWLDGSLVMKQKYVRKIGALATTADNAASFSYLNDGEQVQARMHWSGSNSTTTMNGIYTYNDYSVNENFIRLDFTGKNFPGQIFFGITNEVSADRSQMYTLALDLELNGGYNGYYFNNASGSHSHFGAGRMTAGDGTQKLLYNKIADDNKYVLIAGLEQDLNRPVYIHYELYQQQENGSLLLVEQDKLYNALGADRTDWNTQATGKIMIVGSRKYSTGTGFTMYNPTTLEAQKDRLEKEYTVEYNDAWGFYGQRTTVSTDANTGVSTVALGNNTNADAPNVPYVISQEQYSYDNNFIRVEFNFRAGPYRVLFGVDNESSHAGVSDMKNLVGFGLAMDVGGDGPYYYLKPNATVTAMEAKLTNTGSATNYNQFASGTDYVLIAGTMANDDFATSNKTKLVWKLYSKAGTTLTLIDEGSYARSYTEAQYVGTGKIMLTQELNTKHNAAKSFTVTKPTTLENVMTALSNDYTISAATTTAVSVDYSGSQKQISALGYNGYPSTTLSTAEQQALVEEYAESGMTDLYVQSVLYNGTSDRLAQLKSALDVCAAAGMKNNVIVVDERIANLSAQTTSLIGTDSD